MDSSIFSNERFTQLLDTYGADITTWPAAIRVIAGTWLVTQPEAQRLLEQAEQQQNALKALVTPVPLDSAAHGRLMAGLAARRQSEKRSAALFSPRLAWASAAVAFMLFTGGIWTGERFSPESNDSTAYTVALNTANDDMDADQDAYLDALITGEFL